MQLADPRYVVSSVRHWPRRSHVGLPRTAASLSKHLLAKDSFVLYALIGFVVDQYFPIVEAWEEKGCLSSTSSARKSQRQPANLPLEARASVQSSCCLATRDVCNRLISVLRAMADDQQIEKLKGHAIAFVAELEWKLVNVSIGPTGDKRP